MKRTRKRRKTRNHRILIIIVIRFNLRVKQVAKNKS